MTHEFLEKAILYIETGRYLSALRELRGATLPSTKEARWFHNVLLSQVLECVGDNSGASAAATAALASPAIDSAHKSTCHIVLGSTRANVGDQQGAVEHFQRAGRIARDADERNHVCRAQITLLERSGDMIGFDALASMAGETARLVVRCGDPYLLAHFHLASGTIEGKRGNIERAYQRISLARSIINDRPNLMLESQALLLESALESSKGDIQRAESLAEHALPIAVECGHARVRVGLLGNLGQLKLKLGKIDEAEQYLNSASRLATNRSVNFELALLDTWAQMELFRGNLRSCEEILHKIVGGWSKQRAKSPSFYELVNYETRVRLLLKTGAYEVAATTGARAVDIALARSDRLYLPLFEILTAEALARSGDLASASRLLGRASGRLGSLMTLCEFERAVGVVSAAEGRDYAARKHLETAGRIATITRDACRDQDVSTDRAVIDCLANEAEIQSSSSNHEVNAICVAANFFNMASNPEVLGREAYAFLNESDCAIQLALIAEPEGRPAEVLEASPVTPSAKAINALKKEAGIPLGTWQDRRLTLVAKPKPDLPSRLSVAATHKLISAATSLEQHKREERHRASLWPVDSLPGAGEGVFVSQTMQDIVATARKVAPTPIPVLVTGETGTGKEIIARLIHDHSSVADRPFLPFNCSTVPRDMLDSQLFGYRRGAFTGAHDHFPGVIRAAAGGTLFLDEVADLSPEVQPKLLRFLETGEIHPLGESHPTKVSVRVIAATNANIDRMVEDGTFREDLYYRLNVIRFRLPALRDRREEIPPLLQHFLQQAASELKQQAPQTSDECLEYLLLYRWPGNVRQLANEVRRLVVLADPDVPIVPELLSAEIRAARRTVPAGEIPSPNEVRIRIDQPLAAAFAELERVMLARAMDLTGGKVEAAAQLLGLSRKGLYLKRQRIGMAVAARA